MKKTLKHIAAAMLTLAIALTSISFDNTITANAAMTYEQYMRDTNNVNDYQDTPFTMEIGDKKRFELVEVHTGYWIEWTENYDWSVSDESIITMEVVRTSATSDEVAAFKLVGQKAGTATVTGTNRTDKTKTVSMTVIVKGATKTQTSCKHSWKTTKKATCLYTGTKTCKKCKMKKSIKKKSHNWETYETEEAVTREWVVFECNYDVSDDDFCGMKFSEKTYGSYDAAWDAFNKHKAECGHIKPNWVFWTVPEKIGTKKVTVTKCTTCGETPESVKQYE